ncbi:cytochrome P450 [Candidatus Amarolinea aalborgensis]|uniref:cytochrome P450 n=1 Tax=Candidatus Amarolinea aalborgensis TaxID=2249329 RepID=UPI003BF9CC47
MSTITQRSVQPMPARRPDVSGPAGLPVIGNTLQFQRDPLGFLMHTAADYGDVARYRLGHITFYQINHPDGVQRVLQDNHRNYVKGDLFDIIRRVAGDGLFTSEGELWQRQRRLMLPAFHRRRIAGFGELMTGRTLDMLAQWEQRAHPGQPLDVAEALTGLTMAIISETMFGARLDGDVHAVSQAIGVILADVNFRFQVPFYPSLRWPTPRNRRALAAIRTVDDVVLGIVEQRRCSREERDDLLGMLMEARDEGTGQAMSDKQLRDEVVTIFVAGHETTAVLLTWVFYLLSQHSDVESRLHAELTEVLGGRTPGVADVPNLHTARMVIDETLRLYPPAWITNRQAVADDEICGYHIPAGAVVGISPYVMHHLPAYWPEAERFNPQRFAPDAAHERPRFAYMPFGGGPHQCIGNSFALMEATLILAAVAQRYRLRLPAGAVATPQPKATLRPANGLPMLLDLR